MAEFKECANYNMCLEVSNRATKGPGEEIIMNCEGCHTYGIYKKGFEDGVQALASQLNKLATKCGRSNGREPAP